MSRTSRFRPAGAAAVACAMIGTAMLGAAVLAGCGAGLVTETSSQVASVSGANAGTGPVVVRDAQIEFGDEVEGGNVYPRGADAPLAMSIVNTGADTDRLVSAASAAASSVQVRGNLEIPGGQVLVIDGEPPPSLTTTAGETGGQRAGAIVLTGLRADVRAGLTYPVVLTFARAGEIRLEVPVGGTSVPREDEHAE